MWVVRDSQLEGLPVDDCAEGFAVLDRLLSVSMQVPLLAANLNWEQVGLLEGLHKLFLVLQLCDVLNLGVPGGAYTRGHSHGLSVAVQLNLAHGCCHDRQRSVAPVHHETGSEQLAEEAEAVHIFPDHGAHETHSALERELLDFVRNEPTLIGGSSVEDRGFLSLECHWVLWCVEDLIVQRVVLVRSCLGVGTEGRGEGQDAVLAEAEHGARTD